MTGIGERIRELRIRLGLSQVEFANRIGVSKQTLYKYENGIITNIPSDKIEAIAREFGVSPATIMGWADKPAEQPYYLNDETREIAQAIFDNPQYKALFDASRKLSPEDLRFVMDMIDRMRTD
jgi:transcriptional regulator with XRE-family HTH domain